MEPIFLLSLPRSGSTLLQRVLATNSEIATVSEPWILLPMCYALRKHGLKSEYNQRDLVTALEDYFQLLPHGRKDYFDEVHKLALNLYSRSGSTPSRYFLDKTPRYHLILDELMSIFPDSKIILLWRNPLAVAASMMSTWDSGRWNLYAFHIDLYSGLDALTRFQTEHHKKLLIIRFEDFVNDPEVHYRLLMEHLDLSFDVSDLYRFSSESLHGKMGDPTGTRQLKEISQDSVEKWKPTLANPFRRFWARRYMQWIGPKRLEIMGYSYESLMKEISITPVSTRHMLSDAFRMPYGRAVNAVNRLIFRP